MMNIPDAPWIRQCERTGYPYPESTIVRCACCGERIWAYDEGEYNGSEWLCYDCIDRKEEDDDA